MNLTEFSKHIADNEPMYKKKLILSLLFVIFLITVTVLFNVYRLGQVKEIFENKIQDAQISAITSEYEYHKKIFSGSNKLIAKKEEVEQIQNRLLKKMTDRNLEITSISLLPPKNEKETDSNEYEAVVNGQWEDIMQFLNGFKAEPNIINLKSVRMEVIGEESRPVIKSTFNYKIYFESGGVT